MPFEDSHTDLKYYDLTSHYFSPSGCDKHFNFLTDVINHSSKQKKNKINNFDVLMMTIYYVYEYVYCVVSGIKKLMHIFFSHK